MSLRHASWIGLFTLILSASALAAGPAAKEKSLGTFEAWRAYSYSEGGQRVCYMVTTKMIKSTGPSKRSGPYLMITHRPTEASTDVISYGAGTLINAKHGIKLVVAKSVYELFSVRDTAWARDSLSDHKLAAALRNAKVALASGYPDKKGQKPFVDQFDVSGANAAYQSIGKACGLIDDPKKPTVKNKAAPKMPSTSTSKNGNG